MVIAIRLARHGCTNRPFYHLVAIQHKRARNYEPLEQIGTFDPMPNADNEKLVAVNFERLRYWMSQGARFSKPAARLLGVSGFLPVHPYSYVAALRNTRILEAKTQDQSVEASNDTS
ncbi:PREDICTED: probable 28S ribosomal protein S16, mitochondrial [Priapulus caudatus]|uniref:Small ribosomal subunit protein bS16m n=1 Tax=Priapulus caudatus TaxID=37621 RepID=A0ABM1DZ87_PRICU|nr:PREDICTED: probable 28S ribosomal protein S16, mitochondrial [Priapulus caudatus]